MHRSQSKLRLQHVHQILSDAGYQTWAIHFTRQNIIMLLAILVNQVAAVTHRPVWRVYRRLLAVREYTLKGGRFSPAVVRSLWARMLVDGGDGERRSDGDTDPKVCPCCGRPLPDDLPDLREAIDETPLEPAAPAEVPTIGRR